jgi:hypothetical protein
MYMRITVASDILTIEQIVAYRHAEARTLPSYVLVIEIADKFY